MQQKIIDDQALPVIVWHLEANKHLAIKDLDLIKALKLI